MKSLAGVHFSQGVMILKYGVIIMALLVCLCSSSISEADQSINLVSVGNARELGGYTTADGRTVKHGVLLRTADLHDISGDDVKKLTDIYHLAVIADLRMSLEAAQKPDPVIDGVKYVNLRVINEELLTSEVEKKLTSGDAMERMRTILDSGLISFDMYITFLSDDSGKKAYREFFHELLDLPEGRSILFHCSQGKDRTGCAALLILSALGVSEDTIMNDYLLTNTFNAEKISAQRKMLLSYGIAESELDKYMIVLDEVSPKSMNMVLSWLKDNYVSPLGYIIDELGITREDIETLKGKFLE